LVLALLAGARAEKCSPNSLLEPSKWLSCRYGGGAEFFSGNGRKPFQPTFPEVDLLWEIGYDIEKSWE
jgi:hypothetical protein